MPQSPDMYKHIFLFLEKKVTPPPHLATSALTARGCSVTWPWLTKSFNEYKHVLVFHVVLFFPFFLPRWLTKSKFIGKCLFVYNEVKAGQSLSNKLTHCLAGCSIFGKMFFFFHKILSFWRLGLFILVLHITSFRRGDKLICCTVGICLNEMWVSGWDIWLQKGQGQWQES